jgi:hypothetical protein
MDNLTIFIALTSAAVVIQAGILVAMYLAVRQTSARMEALASEFSTKALPALETAHSIMLEMRPQMENVIRNVSDVSTLVHNQMGRLDATVSDVIDRARLQVIRADELVSRTIDRVEQTTELLQNTVVSPVRQFSGLVRGVTAGVDFLLSARRRHRDGVTVPQDEMFI